MRTPFLFLVLFLVLGLSAFAQEATKPLPSAPSASEEPSKAENSHSDVAPSAPVITLPGVCANKQASTDCQTIVTREDFEKLANALGVPDNQKPELANAYAQLLVVGTAAEQEGIANSPQTQEIMKFVRLQTIAKILAQHVQQEATNVPDSDIQKYYDEHKAQFMQATLQRIFIPKSAPNEKEKPSEATLKAEATKIEAAAKAPGADFAKLQKQVFDDLKIPSTAPPVDLKDIRRDNLPVGQQKIFDLSPGGVSDAMDEPGGTYIYKLVSKDTPPFVKVQGEIKRALEQERFQSGMQKLLSSSKPILNQAYFGPAVAPRPTLGAPTPGAPVKSPGSSGATPASKAPATAPKKPSNPPN